MGLMRITKHMDECVIECFVETAGAPSPNMRTGVTIPVTVVNSLEVYNTVRALLLTGRHHSDLRITHIHDIPKITKVDENTIKEEAIIVRTLYTVDENGELVETASESFSEWEESIYRKHRVI